MAKEIHTEDSSGGEVPEEKPRIFHARFGKWEDGKTLTFGDPIDIPYATDQFSILDMDEETVVGLHQPIAEGIYALAIAGMDDNGIQIFEDKGNQGARFEIANFSWRETPIYLNLRDRKMVLEISNDIRTDVDKSNEENRRLHPEPLFPDYANNPTRKVYIIPLAECHSSQRLTSI